MKNFWHPYYKPEDGLEPTRGLKGIHSDSDTAVLDDLIDNKVDKPGDKDDKDLPDDDKEVISDKDLELDDKDDLLDDKEDKEDKDDDKELTDIESNRGIDLTKIKEKYPEFAKTNEFRELRNAYHREAQYTELFPTIEDAKEAAENNETFQTLNTELIANGSSEKLLNSIKEADPKAFKKVANGFLDTISKLDNPTYVEVITPVVRRLAKQMYTEGKKIQGRNADSDEAKALIATARNILQYAFDSADDIEKDEPRGNNELSEKEKELQTRENNIAQEKLENAYGVCHNSVERNLDKQILDGLDPDGRLNEFTRDILVEKIKNEVKSQIDKDQPHLKRMQSLWKRAKDTGYNRDSLSRIVSAYLERARPIIPGVRSRIRANAIKGRNNDKDDNTDSRDLKLVSRGRTGRAAPQEGKIVAKAVDTKKIDYKNTSDNDIFEGKIKLKG